MPLIPADLMSQMPAKFIRAVRLMAFPRGPVPLIIVKLLLSATSLFPELSLRILQRVFAGKAIAMELLVPSVTALLSPTRLSKQALPALLG